MTSEDCTLIIERNPEVDRLDLVRDEAVGDGAEPRPAVLLGDRRAEQPERAHLAEDRRVGLFVAGKASSTRGASLSRA